MNTAEQLENSLVAGDVAGDYERSLTGDEPLRFTEESWHMDCADYILSENVYQNNCIRTALAYALNLAERMNDPNTIAHQAWRGNALARELQRIGLVILENAIANGLTAEALELGDAP